MNALYKLYKTEIPSPLSTVKPTETKVKYSQLSDITFETRHPYPQIFTLAIPLNREREFEV